jgi:hypothetical protein
MKTQITTITLGILMLASVMAMYSGESMSFTTNLTNPVYTVTGNTSNLEGLTVEFENGNLTISSDPLMASDNFTMIFFDNLTKEIVKTIHTGGGSSSSTKIKYVDNNVTTYIPLYKNITKEVEVEKIVDNTTVIETGYKRWHILLGIVLGIGFGWYMTKKEKKSDVKETD